MSPSRMQPGRPSSRRLSDVARHLILPSDLASTEWPSIQKRTRSMGVRFDQWQADIIRGALGKRSNGKYAATVGGVIWSLPRQVGKTFTVGAMLFAYAIEHPGSLILWTAHHLQTAGETFRSMQGFAKRPGVAPYIENVYTGAGTESVHFKNGARILFGSRERGFGLGFAAVDVIVFDEAQRLSDTTRMDMVPATNRAKNPAGALLFYIGTPPRPNNDGDAFGALRAGALSGDDDVFFVEMSADENADPDDREQWAKANPSYPHHTPLESMLRMRKHLGSDEAWLREALGIWDQKSRAGVIPAKAWQSAADTGSVPTSRFALGLEVGPNLGWASLAVAGQRDDSAWHVALQEDQHTMGRGAEWVTPYVTALLEQNPQFRTVVVDVAGPVKALLEQKGTLPTSPWFFKGTKVQVQPIKVNDLGSTCSTLLASVVTGDVRHLDQPQLSAAALSAGKRALGDTGMWVWSRKTATSDITPIQAATLALHGAQTENVTRPARAGRGRKVVTG